MKIFNSNGLWLLKTHVRCFELSILELQVMSNIFVTIIMCVHVHGGMPMPHHARLWRLEDSCRVGSCLSLWAWGVELRSLGSCGQNFVSTPNSLVSFVVVVNF